MRSVRVVSTMNVKVETSGNYFIASLRIEPSSMEQLRRAQKENSWLVKLGDRAMRRSIELAKDEILRFRDRICVSKDGKLKVKFFRGTL